MGLVFQKEINKIKNVPCGTLGEKNEKHCY